jgi:hypothetical protein
MRNDLFAQIASHTAASVRGGLVEPQPPELQGRELPTAPSNPKAAFRPVTKLDTAEKLQRELERQRKQYAPFLRNLAPAAASSRITLPLETFDWRLETDSDRQDFIATLHGAGDWQTVRIPHYGGPIGRAATYYRTTFQVTEAMLAKETLWVSFKGVDYKASVFVNGAFIGSHEGFFAPFEFEVTSVARTGENILVVKVENDAIPLSDNGSWGLKVDGDKLYAATGPGWDDPNLGWHHCPPGMGTYQAVTIEARSSLHLADVFVRPLPEEQRAEVWVEVFNSGTIPQPVEFTVSLFGQNFPATICRDRAFKPSQTAGPRLNSFRFSVALPKARIWSLETPWLYQIQVALPNGDRLARQFGMRSFRMDTENKPYGRFFLNNREIRLRGANTMGFEQQDVIKSDFGQLRDDLLLAKICHMNFLRLTQRPVQSEVYEMCDRLGLMTQTDLPLFARLPRRQFCEAVRQAEEMERLVRGHPCNIMVSFINEPFPLAWGDKTHRHCTRAELESFFEAASRAVQLANPDRVIKPVDGDYDPPARGLPDNHCYCCWYNGHGVDIGKLHKGYWQQVKPDWFYGCGEFGAEGLDPVNVMRKYYPQAWLPQSLDEEANWSPLRIQEAQTGKYHSMFFDIQRTLNGWVAASQRHQAWATRIMTEAFRRDNRMNSFAIHLFIDAFPAGWMKAIMDVERQPKPAFFAYREALTPLMANLRADRWVYTAGETMQFECWVCNDTHLVPAGAQLRYQLEVAGKVVFAQQASARVKACRSMFQGVLRIPAPSVPARTRARLRLALTAANGRILHDTAQDLQFFPKPAALPKGFRVAVIGRRNGKAARLAREIGLNPVFDLDGQPSTILMDDLALFAKHRRRIAAAVAGGATAVLLELPAGEHEIAGTKLKVDICGMFARHFVSRDTGHPLVAGFEPEDFRLWYEAAAGRISPLLETCFQARDWEPVLTTGNGGWTGEWVPALAAAEKRHGSGVYRLCQITLAGRTATNPIAAQFARRLLGVFFARLDIHRAGA